MATYGPNSYAVIVDPISTGLQVTEYCQNIGVRVVALFSTAESTCKEHFAAGLARLSFEKSINYEGENPETDVPVSEDPALMKVIGELKELPYELVAVLPGCESGVTLSERLASHFPSVRSNGLEKLIDRRDKYHMSNTVGAAGIRSVRQVRPETWEEVEKFVKEVNPSPFKIIMKPSNSAGSDGVVCCKSMEEVRARWDHISKSQEVNILGQPMDVLVQEFLQGTEYVVNAVSRDGVHKVTCVWEYEKRAINGGDFTYLAMRLVPPAKDGEAGQFWRQLVDYNNKVLDALDIKNGASHAEIMVKRNEVPAAADKKSFVGGLSLAGVAGASAAAAAGVAMRARTSSVVALSAAAAAAAVAGYAMTSKKTTPLFDICLVEVGSRCQGAEGTFIPITDHCKGYNQAQLTASSYLDGVDFDATPLEPLPLTSHGVIVWLVNSTEGTFRGLLGEKKIRELDSFQMLKLDVNEGEHILKTVNVMTMPGCVTLVHESKKQIEADISAIRGMEENGLFIVEEKLVA